MVTSFIRSLLLFYEGEHFPFSPCPFALGGQKVRAGVRLGMLGVVPTLRARPWPGAGL